VEAHSQRPSRNDDRVKVIEGMDADSSRNAKIAAVDLIVQVSKDHDQSGSFPTEIS
jgi:hypothetical protein